MIDQLTLKMETLTACPVCGSADFAPYNLTVWMGGKLYYYECDRCGVYFLNPRMTDDQLGEYYAGQYRDSLKVIEGSDEVINARDKMRQEQRAKKQIEMCGEYFKGCITSLEIGCSLGMLMDELNEIDIYPEGVEPDVRYHSEGRARKYKVYRDISEVSPFAYDLICMSHSLEHLNHPLDYMRMLVANYAHAGTRFMIEVPNGDKNIVERPHHPFGFGKRALDWLMAEVGYKPLSEKYYHGLFGDFAYDTYLLEVFGREQQT